MSPIGMQVKGERRRTV